MIDYTKKSSYNYYLPEELIAQTPLEPRDHSRLLVYDRKSKDISHRHFYNVLDYLNNGDVLVVNNSRVLPARLFGKKEETNANIEFLLQKRYDLKNWRAIARPFKRLKEGTKVIFSNKLSAVIKTKYEYGECDIEFIYDGHFEEILAEIGETPLPPYIKKRLENKERYQTVYSKVNGSSAAPTAGLHFTEELLNKIKAKGVKIVEVLLHVGLGTFRPVKEDSILNHDMHSEYYKLTEENANVINEARKNGGKIIAVGTTSVRVLETCSDENGILHASFGETKIFIYPPYKFKAVDHLITNFHLPESTLIMLVSAFCGLEETLNLYNLAVKQNYRLFTFGDAMLLL